MSNKIQEKLNKLKSDKNEIIIKLEYKGKILQKQVIELPDYTSEIIEGEDIGFYYFCKDMANKLEEKIMEAHKKKVWDDLKNKKDDSSKDSK